jgi:hypothetical protein
MGIKRQTASLHQAFRSSEVREVKQAKTLTSKEDTHTKDSEEAKKLARKALGRKKTTTHYCCCLCLVCARG